MKRNIANINKKIKQGNIKVLTAEELCNSIREGKKIKMEDVDVITTATCGLMSGTCAILSFPVCKRNLFRKAEIVYLNGIPCLPGPAPNERLGEIDTIVYGTSKSLTKERYGGGHLFREIVEGKSIEVEVLTEEKKKIESSITIKDMSYARIFATRNAFKNYIGFLNKKNDSVKTIFHFREMQGNYKELTFCGCGEINPLEKDLLNTIGIGSKVLINNAIGYVVGLGTRSTIEKPSLSAIADMYKMKAEYMGGFITSGGIEAILTWAVPIPILNEKIFENVKKTDDKITLPIADIHDRIPFANIDYGKVWQGVDLVIKYKKEDCENCEDCEVEKICPTNAFSSKENRINKKLCFECGACTTVCKAFKGNLGKVFIDNREVPITLRQSNKRLAISSMKELKEKILSKEFLLTEPIEKISFSKKDEIPCRFCERSYCTKKIS